MAVVRADRVGRTHRDDARAGGRLDRLGLNIVAAARVSAARLLDLSGLAIVRQLVGGMARRRDRREGRRLRFVVRGSRTVVAKRFPRTNPQRERGRER